MIDIIAGAKGKGKTKILIQQVKADKRHDRLP